MKQKRIAYGLLAVLIFLSLVVVLDVLCYTFGGRNVAIALCSCFILAGVFYFGYTLVNE